MNTFINWINSEHFLSAFCLPAAFSLYFICKRLVSGKRVIPPFFIKFTLIGVIATLVLELATPLNNGIWLVPAWFAGYVMMTAKADRTLSVIRLESDVAFYGTFFSVLIADVFTAAAVGFPLQYLGGMGFKDGLLVYPLIALALTAYTNRLADFHKGAQHEPA